ncbi:hypothetical protein TRAPUB_13794 [Trametes pubescens]|uniref:Uncharacterized protein n=1 Tax=Trametes pubescens TaxID=154538 RepID=A0A1M2VQ86_TRAPU|nr:hypothetical protein TRAPUB_13794 [Trametes pubescens]
MANAHTVISLTAFERFLLGSPDPIIDKFFSRWTIDQILSLRRVNSNLLLAVEGYSARAWSIDTTFDRWFYHVQSFLEVLDACEGIVAGSEAQQHFARHEFRGKDLDIYVPCHGLLRMGRWLKSEGFRFQTSGGKHILFDAAAVMFSAATVGNHDLGGRDVYGSPLPNAFSSFNFVRFPTDNLRMLDMDGCRVQLIAVRGDPIPFMINNFHSTGVMNYITGKYAVSLFPRHTFVERQMFICQDMTRNAHANRSWIAKYRGRGFTVIGATDERVQSAELRAWDRTVGDRFTWVLPHARSVIPGKLTLNIPRVGFEVLPAQSGVAASGAALRLGPKFIYSSMALIATGDDFGHIGSTEIVAAFAEYAVDT